MAKIVAAHATKKWVTDLDSDTKRYKISKENDWTILKVATMPTFSLWIKYEMFILYADTIIDNNVTGKIIMRSVLENRNIKYIKGDRTTELIRQV